MGWVDIVFMALSHEDDTGLGTGASLFFLFVLGLFSGGFQSPCLYFVVLICLLFLFVAELATCCGDVSASACADVCVYFLRSEDSLKFVDVIAAWSLVGEASHFVVADEVDIASYGFDEFCELFGVLWLVVDVSDESVFESYFSSCIAKIFSTGIHEFFD